MADFFNKDTVEASSKYNPEEEELTPRQALLQQIALEAVPDMTDCMITTHLNNPAGESIFSQAVVRVLRLENAPLNFASFTAVGYSGKQLLIQEDTSTRIIKKDKGNKVAALCFSRADSEIFKLEQALNLIKERGREGKIIEPLDDISRRLKRQRLKEVGALESDLLEMVYTLADSLKNSILLKNIDDPYGRFWISLSKNSDKRLVANIQYIYLSSVAPTLSTMSLIVLRNIETPSEKDRTTDWGCSIYPMGGGDHIGFSLLSLYKTLAETLGLKKDPKKVFENDDWITGGGIDPLGII